MCTEEKRCYSSVPNIIRDVTVNSTSDYTLCTYYHSYFKGISANIELKVYSVTCC
jgi:hypothetical protein